MKLLFDQNISFRLIRKITDLFPDSKQVRELSLENSTDIEIFNYAKKFGFTIVTFDSDFFDLYAYFAQCEHLISLQSEQSLSSLKKNVSKPLISLIMSLKSSLSGSTQCDQIAAMSSRQDFIGMSKIKASGTFIKPRSPQLNGKVERSHRTDQEEFYQLLTYTDDVD